MASLLQMLTLEVNFLHYKVTPRSVPICILLETACPRLVMYVSPFNFNVNNWTRRLACPIHIDHLWSLTRHFSRKVPCVPGVLCPTRIWRPLKHVGAFKVPSNGCICDRPNFIVALSCSTSHVTEIV